MKVQVIKLPHAKDLPLPEYKTAGSSGMDLSAAIDKPVDLKSGDYTLIPCGIAVAIPEGYELQIRSRSGLAAKYAVVVSQGVGTIDSDYRGELGVTLINHGKQDFTVNRGDRIAQAVLAKVEKAELVEGETLPQTKRGSGAFGSTGIKP